MASRTAWTDERLDEKMVAIEQRLDRIEVRLDRIEARLDQIQDRLVQIGFGVAGVLFVQLVATIATLVVVATR
jgi:hypothetical protein